MPDYKTYRVGRGEFRDGEDHHYEPHINFSELERPGSKAMDALKVLNNLDMPEAMLAIGHYLDWAGTSMI